jgi:spore germination cell wall hydrolase CwlJ-like protein
MPAGAVALVPMPDGRPLTGDFSNVLAVGTGLLGGEPAALMARLYFDREPMGEALEPVQPWPSGEAPKVETLVVSVDSAEPAHARPPARSAVAGGGLPAAAPAAAGETIATKGEVTGEGRRPMTPAEQLGLHAGNRARQERCLSEAVYFEARGEQVRGQIGVAQVVLNRAFSGYYPTTVCGVVYQNAHRYLRCQFTFACDRHREVIRDQEAWGRARAIATGVLDGRLWLPEVGKATHYHATHVRPSWVRNMQRLHRVGLHVFYRPHRWGDGSDAPTWGDEAATAEATRAL